MTNAGATLVALVAFRLLRRRVQCAVVVPDDRFDRARDDGDGP